MRTDEKPITAAATAARSASNASYGDMEELGGKFYAVNVACLDDATG